VEYRHVVNIVTEKDESASWNVMLDSFEIARSLRGFLALDLSLNLTPPLFRWRLDRAVEFPPGLGVRRVVCGAALFGRFKPGRAASMANKSGMHRAGAAGVCGHESN
jgi:hypothetical protein